MKRGTPEHFKTMRLATLLSTPERPCDRAEALGIVEALCNHFAPRSAPQGNVGRCTDQEIADGCYSTRPASQLVSALVQSGWLDECEEFRLVIHDWKEHADEAVRKWLLRNHFQWATVSGLCRVRVRMPSRRHLDGVRPPRAGNGNGNIGLISVLPGGVQGEPSKPRPKITTPLPDPFPLTDKMRDYATKGGLDAGFEFGKFKDHHRARGTKFLDWEAAWRNWCRTAYTIKQDRGRA